MATLQELDACGQSIWLDYIRRGFVTSGELGALIREGLKGLTSNPNIFEKAIDESSEYREDLSRLAGTSLDSSAIYEQLAISDVQHAADEFRGVYEASEGRDGFVSLEVSPELSRDTKGTLVEARRLWAHVNRSNLMIKVPGTPEGIPAIQTLISEGINVNVTLLFSVPVYEQVAQAYIAGLEQRAARGGNIGRMASVASFFVSRVDSVVDKLLDEKLKTASEKERLEVQRLFGKAAIANAKLAYERYQHIIASDAWKGLAAHGARPQRVLWASTGTKNPKYRDVLYIEELIGPDTVNTVPPATLKAFRDHGRVRTSLTENVKDAHSVLDALASAGISMEAVSEQLLVEGEKLFVDAFQKLIAAVEAARQKSAKAV